MIKESNEVLGSKIVKYRLVATQNLKEHLMLKKSNQNPYFQFKIACRDENNHSDYSIVQLIYVNKYQRLRLVFAKSLDKVLESQDEFRTYISRLTGYKAIIDKIDAYKINNTANRMNSFTQMTLHFINSDENLVLNHLDLIAEQNLLVINAEKILSIFDRSNDLNLIKKYKLILAEKYENELSSMSNLNEFKEAADFDPQQETSDQLKNSESFMFGATFWRTNTRTFFLRLFIFILILGLLILTLTIMTICCCMRLSYKRKLRAERALVKAFGLEQRSLNYAETINGYVNGGFDSPNSLLPIPGTSNLYAYEGSTANHIWLTNNSSKYDKLNDCNNPTTSSSSSASSTHENESNKRSSNKKRHNDDISSFYLKQIDSSPTTSKCSPSSFSNEKTSSNGNKTMTSDVYSIQDCVSSSSQDLNNSHETETNAKQVLSSFKTEAALLTFVHSSSVGTAAPVTLSKNETNKKVVSFRSQLKTLENNIKMTSGGGAGAQIPENRNKKFTHVTLTNNDFNQNAHNNQKMFKKIFDLNQENDHHNHTNAQKEFCDLFEVESTVI